MRKSRPTLVLTILLMTFMAGCGSKSKKEKDDPKTGKAEVGITGKGEGYGNMVPILKPAATFMKVQEKIAFEIAIPKSMQLFEAINSRKPKSHQEFMDRIIGDGKIKLPKLDEGLEYFYDVKKGELMVRSKPDETADSN